MSFNHYHVHSSLSLLDGISKRIDLIKLAKSHGAKTVACTDHGSLANHISFYKDCVKNEIKAALGIETYVAPDSRLNREYKTVDKEDRGDISKSSYHLTLIAKNRIGYQNLIKISSDAYRNGFYKKPRTDLEFLQQHKEGIVVLSGCLGSITSQYILAGQTDKAIEYINKYRYMFGEDFLIELMQHDIPAEKMVYDALAHIGQTYGIPLILTNDSHFTSKEDAKAQEAALNINNMKVTLNSPEHWSFDGSGYWFKTPQEMQEVINKTGWPQSAYDNTSWLADRIEDYAFETGKHIVPKFKDHSNRQWDTQESHQKLTMMAYQGLNDKGLTNEPTYIDRLKYELDVMERKDFSSYFLIIADIVDFMRRSGFPLSPGRGSAVGSLVCYATNITGANPLTWGVPFERFINEGRKDLPDVDTDISQRHRKEVIQYIVDRYGHDNVAIIATYQQMTVKSVIDKVGRVLGVPPQVRRELSKIIGHTDKDDKLADVLENNPKVQTVLDSVPLWTDICKRLEGNYSNQSQHAAGVVISNDPIINHVPLGRDTEDGFLTTQYDMNDVQALGLLKLDMLGLTTLDIIDDAKKLVKQFTGQNVEVGDLNDLEPYKLLSSGNYVSTFQGDSHGYRALARKLVPDKFEHIMAFTALYRPGPMMPEKIVDAKGHTTKGPSILDHYVERRHGREPPDVWHPSLQDVFQDTYGNCLYQEQVGEVAKRLAGFNPEEADQLRKAIGKKDQALFDKMTALLVEGGIRLGHSEELIRGIAQKLSGSARYSWGRGHCLSADTNILTCTRGWIPITDIKPGEELWSVREGSGELFRNRVLDLVDNGVHSVVSVQSGSNKIVCTPNHRFMTTKQSYIYAAKMLGRHCLQVLHQGISGGNLDIDMAFIANCYKVPFHVAFDNVVRNNMMQRQPEIGKTKPTSILIPIQQFEPQRPGHLSINSTTKTFSSYKFENTAWVDKHTTFGQPSGNCQLAFDTSSLDLLNGQSYFGCNRQDTSASKADLLYEPAQGRRTTPKWQFSKNPLIAISRCVQGAYQFFIGIIRAFLATAQDASIVLRVHADVYTDATTGTGGPLHYNGSGFRPISSTSGGVTDGSRHVIGYGKQAATARAGACYEIVHNEVHSITPAGSRQVFDLTMEQDPNFVANGFVVHNSVAYGINTYTTALLEAKYPLAYYVALLNANVGEAEEMAKLLARIMQKGVSVQPPHINTSSDIFTTDGKNIYMGLSSVRQLGDNALQAIVSMRQAGPFQSFLDFCRRSQMVASRTVTKAVKENLIKAGAFAWDLSIPDADKLANVELLAKILKKKPHADDLSLALQLQLTGKEISGPERAEYEKAVLSFYVSGHPISSFLAMPSVFSEDLNIISVSQLKTAEPNMAVNLLGLLIEKEVRISKRNTPYLRLTVQDQFETTTCVIFQNDLVDKLSKTLPQSSIVLIAGVTEISTFKDGEIDLRVKDVTQLTHGIPVAGIRIDQTQPIQYYSQYFGVNSWHSIQALPSNKWLATFKTPIRVTAEHLEGFQKLNGMKLVLGRSEPWANPQ